MFGECEDSPVAVVTTGVRQVVRAAWGTAVVFAVSGSIVGTWISRLPATRDRLHARTTELGLVLLAPGLGSMLSMPLTGRLCRRFGSRATVAAMSVPACGAVALLAVVPTLPALAVTLFAWGLLYGSWDVAMNVQGSTVDQRAGRVWMPRYHACWSLGGVVGAAVGALAARQAVPVWLHFGVAAVVSMAIVLVSLRWFITDAPDRDAPDPAAVPERLRKGSVLTPRLMLIGFVTLCATTIEGAAADWLPLYLVDDRGAPQSVAASGFAAFAVSMAAGRFAGTAIIERLGRDGAVRAGGLTSIAGVALTVFGPWLATVYLGALLWALGICLIFPAAISAAGEMPDRPADAIAAVATMGYGAFLFGPPLIGVLADHVGLGRALLVLIVLGAATSLNASAVRGRLSRP
jgi:fucose permease